MERTVSVCFIFLNLYVFVELSYQKLEASVNFDGPLKLFKKPIPVVLCESMHSSMFSDDRISTNFMYK